MSLYFNIIIFSFLGLIILYYTFKYIEQTYAERFKTPFFINFTLLSNQLTEKQISILRQKFTFYNRLDEKEKKIFRHRVHNFIGSKTFVGRQGLEVSDEMKVLIAATAVMLTFGFRNYKLPIFHSVLIYPEPFMSAMNDNLHKGEVNPKHGVIALSWKDFLEGFDIANDNLNLGIHEFAHAVHLNSHVKRDISSQIFIDNFKALKRFLKHNEDKRKQLISTRYFREYAYTNEFEFVAVLLECFFETPDEFKANFPILYQHVKTMLNFNYAGY